jgi:hypothetical protein
VVRQKGSVATSSKGGEEVGWQHPAQITAVQATDHRHPSTSFSQESTYIGSASNQLLADRPTDDKKKGANNKEVPIDPSNLYKKLWVSTGLDPK